MAQFDPLLRRETWCFQRTSQKNSAGKDCILGLPFKFVEYDGVPDRYLEPINMHPTLKGPLSNMSPVDPVVDGTTIAGIEVFDSISEALRGLHEFHFI